MILFRPFGMFGFIVPIFFVLIGVRVLRSIFRGDDRRSHRKMGEYDVPPLPYDDATRESHYVAAPSDDPIEASIFKLAKELKGRLTVSDIVIGTNLGLKDAERVIDGMVDGAHVTMEVSDSGRVIYEFPEIIARFEDDEKGKGISKPL